VHAPLPLNVTVSPDDVNALTLRRVGLRAGREHELGDRERHNTRGLASASVPRSAAEKNFSLAANFRSCRHLIGSAAAE
jgi:hypothetical protein